MFYAPKKFPCMHIQSAGFLLSSVEVLRDANERFNGFVFTALVSADDITCFSILNLSN